MNVIWRVTADPEDDWLLPALLRAPRLLTDTEGSMRLQGTRCLPVLCVSTDPTSATISQAACNPQSFTFKGQNLRNIDLEIETSGDAKVKVARPHSS